MVPATSLPPLHLERSPPRPRSSRPRALLAVTAALLLGVPVGCGGTDGPAGPETPNQPDADPQIVISSGNQDHITLSQGQEAQIPIRVDLSGAGDENVGEVRVTITWNSRFVKALAIEPGQFGEVSVDREGMFEGVLRAGTESEEGTQTSFDLIVMIVEGFHINGGTRIEVDLEEIRNESGESLVDITRIEEIEITVSV